jgi:TonB family protein
VLRTTLSLVEGSRSGSTFRFGSSGSCSVEPGTWNLEPGTWNRLCLRFCKVNSNCVLADKKCKATFPAELRRSHTATVLSTDLGSGFANPSMFTQSTQIPRSPVASVLTVVFHAGLALLAVMVTAVPNLPALSSSRDSITFVMTAPLPDLAFDPPAPPLPDKATPRVEPSEPPKMMEAPALAKPPAPPPPRVEDKVFERPREEAPPVPRAPAIVVGSFAEAPAPSRAPDRSIVAAAGFDTADSQGTRTRRTLTAVEGFETQAAGARGARVGPVSDAGFGATARADARQVARAGGVGGFSAEESRKPMAQPPRSTGASGFAADAAPRSATASAPPSAAQPAGFVAEAAPRPTPPPPPPVVAQPAFDETPAPTRAKTPVAPARRVDRPAEVLHKPVPEYTDEARARRIEGEVTLDVEFTATGQVRVLRVVQGLGYGLDEMARRAAEQIRFTPAMSGGKPIDTRTRLTIVFRLT